MVYAELDFRMGADEFILDDGPSEDEVENSADVPNDATDPLENVPVDDLLGLYFGEVGQTPLLSAEEEIALGNMIQEGIKAKQILESNTSDDLDGVDLGHLENVVSQGFIAREDLARANTRWVITIAKKLYGIFDDNSLPLQDMIQEGNIGLMKAVDKFDPSRGNRFSTVAAWWIEQTIKKAIIKKAKTVRLPDHAYQKARRGFRRVKEVNQGGSLDTTAFTIEFAFGADIIDEKVYEQLVDVESWGSEEEQLFSEIQKEVSMYTSPSTILELDAPVDDEDGNTFGDFVEGNGLDLAQEAFLMERHMLLEEALGLLDDHDAHILRLRNGLYPEQWGQDMTLEQIGEMYGVSKQTVSQWERRAIRRLKHRKQAWPLQALKEMHGLNGRDR